MRAFRSNLLFILLIAGISWARKSPDHGCVAFSDASKHIGMSGCVSGTVVHIEDENDGITLLNFCEDVKSCPFTVVVLAADLNKLGDLRQLEGRQIEIKGTIQDYDGRTQMILRRTQQLGESAFDVIPRVPTDYDVERRGHYSAGKYSHPKAKKTSRKHGSSVSIEDPEEPQ